ncbi:hypothetical protein [Dyella thiooxydans]|uniref:hypothetical protein n=1 Tax=Dyella thiooxydans TaxID=445710 RepID=UPI0012F8FCA8|nr:hypothetical protein [Dyella thiooxydans]
MFSALNSEQATIISALFGVVGTVIGLLLGAAIQSIGKGIDRRRERFAVYDFGCELVLNVRHMACSFGNFEELKVLIVFGSVVPQVIAKEMDWYLDWSRKNDPGVAINGMWLKQALSNLEVAVQDVRGDVKVRSGSEDSPFSDRSDSFLALSGSVSGCVRYCDYLLWLFFIRGGLRTALKVLRARSPIDLWRVFRGRPN